MFQKIKALFAAQRRLQEIQSQLDEYNLQLGGGVGILTVESLIESHLSTREINQTISREYRENRKRGYDSGYAQGLEIATSQDYINVDRLRGMTVQELVDLIGEK